MGESDMDGEAVEDPVTTVVSKSKLRRVAFLLRS